MSNLKRVLIVKSLSINSHVVRLSTSIYSYT